MPVDVFADMNERQREAIAHIDGPLLVVAGAGSGKTRVITHRIAHLIQRGVRPDHILAITFTNKAAGEMQERVEGLLHLRTPWIATFHSAAMRILKLEQRHLGLAHPFTIIDADDQLKAWRRVLERLGIDSKDLDPRVVAAQVSRWKNELKSHTEVARLNAHEGRDPYEDDRILACYRAYVAQCREECVFDFDDLLFETVALFEREPEVLARYRERFPYILIDEYQDTNHAQYRFFRLLGEHGNICATGDPDQAIYGWRGADISNILRFEQDYPDCRVVLLEQNYRSTKTILAAAQAVVEHNTQRKPKTIFTDNPQGEPIRLITVDDQDDEAMAVAAAVDRMHADGVPYHDIAVFYRMNAQSRTVEEWLIRRAVPYRIIGGTRFYDRAEVKDLLAYSRLLINPRDLASLLRIINVPRRGIGDQTLAQLRGLAQQAGVPPFEVLMTEDLLERVAVGRAAKPLRAFAALMRRLMAEDLNDAAACLQRIMDLTDLAQHYERTDPEKAAERVDNLMEALTAAEQFGETRPGAGLEAFLDHVSLLTSQDNRGTSDQMVLMTLHAAKGLEFPYVFIVGCEQGILPLIRKGQQPDYEEERRLMYVGITRAMQRLYLSCAASRRVYNEWINYEPSMFLAEIPDHCIDHASRRRRPQAYGHIPMRDGPGYPGASMAGHIRGEHDDQEAAQLLEQLKGRLLTSGAALKQALNASHTNRPPRRADLKLKPGMAIIHQTLGPGTVVRLSGRAQAARITIDFQGVGRRTLALPPTMAQLRLP